jgi:GT2 family glycosyltransferase
MKTVPPASKMTDQRVLAVIVVYGRKWEEVVAANYLIAQLDTHPSRSRFLIDKLIIYDNSPVSMAMPARNHSQVHYLHDRQNGGTRSAYDFALAQALDGGQEWILLLDQDTVLPEDYLDSVSDSVAARRVDEIDVLLPWVADQDRAISPARITRLGSIAPLKKNRYRSDGSECVNLTGIASGSIIRTSALRSIPTLPPQLWLDYVDHWIFHQLNLAGAKMVVVDATLQHALSIMNISDVSSQRLHSILDGERLFSRSLGLTAAFIYPLRIALRLVRLSLTNRAAAKNLRHWLWPRRTP